MTPETQVSEASRQAVLPSGIMGLCLPLSWRTLESEFIATQRQSPSLEASVRLLTCPKCRRSKHPLVRTKVLPEFLASSKANGFVERSRKYLGNVFLRFSGQFSPSKKRFALPMKPSSADKSLSPQDFPNSTNFSRCSFVSFFGT